MFPSRAPWFFCWPLWQHDGGNAAVVAATSGLNRDRQQLWILETELEWQQDMKTYFLGCVCALVLFTPTRAVNIAWVSLHGTDMATAAAQGHGFTQAAGQEYVNLLRDNGHVVTRVLTQSPNHW